MKQQNIPYSPIGLEYIREVIGKIEFIGWLQGQDVS
jgi:hypothetical protein